MKNLTDGPSFMPAPGEGLSAHLAYGFAAVGERVIQKDDVPTALTQLVHFDIAPDAMRPFHLQLDAATEGWLQTLHAEAGMEDYDDMVRLLDDGPYEEVARRHGAVAFLRMTKAKKSIRSVNAVTHCALYDILDQRWGFVTISADRIRAMFPELADMETDYTP